MHSRNLNNLERFSLTIGLGLLIQLITMFNVHWYLLTEEKFWRRERRTKIKKNIFKGTKQKWAEERYIVLWLRRNVKEKLFIDEGKIFTSFLFCLLLVFFSPNYFVHAKIFLDMFDLPIINKFSMKSPSTVNIEREKFWL
jgi:hypothetical protein